MRRKTLIRAAASLCLLVTLAACARESAPAPADSPESAPSPASEPAVEETRAECLRLVSNSLEQNKSELPLYETLALDREVFFADYTGGGFQVVPFERARTENDPLLSCTYMTNDAYFWYDRTGEATPEQAAGELVRVMLEDLKSQPEFGRTFTVTEYSVKEQTLCAWENIPERVLGSGAAYNIAGLSHDEAVKLVKEQLSRDVLQRETPFEYTGFAYALPEDMWALDPYFTFDYTGVANGYSREEMEILGLTATADDDGLFPENQRGKPEDAAHIIVRDGNVWRMQRAEAMERMFAETVRTERWGGYSLNQLEHSMIEGGREYYIEGAASEYLRRLRSDPEDMYAHMDELGMPRLAWLCNELSYAANSEDYTPEGDSYSAGLLGKYTAYHDKELGSDERVLPPATGVICPPLLSEDTRAMIVRMQYEDDALLIFQAGPGLFAYDFEQGEIVFSADLLTAMGWDSPEGNWVTRALVDADGGRIRLAYREYNWDHWLVRYEIDTADWSREAVEYEMSGREWESLFNPDGGYAGQGKIELRTKTGTNATDRLRDLVYIRGDEEIRLFDGVDFGAYGEITPVPAVDLERSVHNVLLSRAGGLSGGFKCEAHETLDARPDGAGNTVCYVAFQCEAFSSANGAPLSTAFERGCAALTFRPDENGRYVLTDFDSPSGGLWGEEIARIFPEDLRKIMHDGEIEDRLAQSCISQAMEHYGLEPEAD